MSHLQAKSNRKLRFPPWNIIHQSLDSSIIEQVAFNLAAITSNLRVSRNREIDCSSANAEGIQSDLTQFGTAFLRWHCRFSKSRLCAIDRAAVARPFSPYSVDLGHFDVHSMHLTYWPICTAADYRDVVVEGEGEEVVSYIVSVSARITRSVPPISRRLISVIPDTMLQWPTDPNAKVARYWTLFSLHTSLLIRNNVRDHS